MFSKNLTPFISHIRLMTMRLISGNVTNLKRAAYVAAGGGFWNTRKIAYSARSAICQYYTMTWLKRTPNTAFARVVTEAR